MEIFFLIDIFCLPGFYYFFATCITRPIAVLLGGQTDRQTSSQDDRKTDRHTIGWKSNLIEKRVDIIVSPFSLPLSHSRRVVSYKRMYVHEVLYFLFI